MDETVLTPAEKMYKNHLKNVSNYQKRNVEKMREKNKIYFLKIKTEMPEKYNAMLLKKKEYYNNKKRVLETVQEVIV